MKGGETVEIVTDRQGVLEAVDHTQAAGDLGGPEVRGGTDSHQDIRVAIDIALPDGDLMDGVLEGAVDLHRRCRG